jgi:hypothetical protein
MDGDLPKLTPEQFRHLMEEVRAAKQGEGSMEMALIEAQRKFKAISEMKATKEGSANDKSADK